MAFSSRIVGLEDPQSMDQSLTSSPTHANTRQAGKNLLSVLLETYQRRLIYEIFCWGYDLLRVVYAAKMHPTLRRMDLYSAYQHRNREMCWLVDSVGLGTIQDICRAT